MEKQKQAGRGTPSVKTRSFASRVRSRSADAGGDAANGSAGSSGSGSAKSGWRRCRGSVRSGYLEPGQGVDLHGECAGFGRAERVLGAGATELRSESGGGGQCFERRIPVARRASGSAGASRRSDDRHAANHGHAASGGGGRFGTGGGGDAHFHGEGSGPVGADHHSRRSAGSGHAADCDERGAGGDYDSVEAVDLDHLKRVIDKIRRSGKVSGTKTLIVLGTASARKRLPQ